MINLIIRSSFSFNKVFAPLEQITKINNDNYLCITDNNTYGWNYLQQYKKENNKIIYGVELLLTEDYIHPCGNIFLLAQNLNGAKTIFNLCSVAFNNKINLPLLPYYSLNDLKDVIVIVTDLLIYFKLTKIIEKKLFFGFALTYFNNENNIENNDLLYQIPKEKIVAISDNLFLNKEDEIKYKIFISKGKKRNFNNLENRHLLTEEEWIEKAHILSKEQKEYAIKNTYEIAKQIEQFDLPQAHIPQTSKAKITLIKLCIKGLKKKNISLNNKKYKERLKQELNLICSKNDLINYFLIIYDIIKFCHRNSINIGVGRGSSVACLVCYCLDIIKIDPIEYDLMFERFLNKERLNSLPDIDLDIQSNQRQKIIQYIYQKYGKENSGKIGRILNLKLRNIYRFWLEYFPELKQFQKYFYNDNTDINALCNLIYEKTHNKLFLSIKEFYNLPFAHGIHPSGIIINNYSLNYLQTVYVNNNERELAIDVNFIDNFNILKIDLLSSNIIETIDKCLKNINKNFNWFWNLDKNDKKVYEIIFNKNDTTGIFQFEGEELIRLLQKIKINNFNELINLIALARPGSSKNTTIQKYINNNLSNIKNEQLKTILQNTNGIIIFQEDLMKICKEIFNASESFVQKIRKIISKKIDNIKMLEIKKQLFSFPTNNSQEYLEEAWNLIEQCNGFLFCKAHAVAYGFISYGCAYLKTYYPFDYLISILNNNISDLDIVKIINYLLEQNYQIKLFDLNNSDATKWIYKNNIIYAPITIINNINKTEAEIIKKNIEFKKDISLNLKRKILNETTKFDFILYLKKFYKNYFNKEFIVGFLLNCIELENCYKLLYYTGDKIDYFYTFDKKKNFWQKNNFYFLKINNKYIKNANKYNQNVFYEKFIKKLDN